MIANARMYSVAPAVAEWWRQLLGQIAARAKVPLEWLEHTAPAPISELWSRADMGAVFMCGLPYARAQPRPQLVAAPVPSAPDFRGQPVYWSELVVRADSALRSIGDTFGGRIALTTMDSQSGCLAALYYLIEAKGPIPLYREVIAPQVTPLRALTAVIEGRAEVAPVDCYAFCLLQAYRPDLTGQVRVVARTAPTPIPPLVASASELRSGPARDSLESAFLEAHNIPSMRAPMAALRLERFARPDPASYEVLAQRFEAAAAFWRAHRFAGAIHPAFAPLMSGRVA